MTKETKFRAWDKDKKIFLPQDSFAVLTNHCSGALFVMLKDFENYKEGEFGYQNSFELMQYTGLHDKNGKEIYKGDIFDMGVIGFDRGCFNGFYTESRSDDKGWDYSDSWEDGMYHYVLQNEIIGNIYENPDLLNKE